VAFKSDHPVLNSQHLIFEAAKAHAYGYDEKLAIQAVTSIPAKLMGQAWRIGLLAPHYDADIVVWDRHPLQIGAKPVRVFTDGIQTFYDEYHDHQPMIPRSKSIIPQANDDDLKNNETTFMEKLSCSPQAKTFKIVNIDKLYADENRVYSDASLVVDKGVITCIGEGAEACPVETSNTHVVNAQGGSIIPVSFF
jgi:imidazolonepropionase-like amidohydrolase